MSLLKTIEFYPPIHEIFQELPKDLQAVFLDSSLHNNERGQFSIIAARPYLSVEEKDSRCMVNGEHIEESCMEFVRNYLNDHYEENLSGLPITSGCVGYFSYDYGREKEGVKTQHVKKVDIPDCILRFYDCFIIEDHRKGTLTIAANGKTENPHIVISEVASCIEKTFAKIRSRKTENASHQADDLIYTTTVEADFSQEDYKTAVDHMIKYIVDGDIYVVNMTHQLRMKSDCPPAEMFKRLRERNPSPFGAYLDYEDFQIICASPERFMQMTNGLISTRPIKGTRKRGATPEEDLALKEELANSDKDQSELLMIVDLERNDLNRVCVPGSVKVTELFKVETYATVFHLESNIVGQILPGKNAMDLVKAAFPGGSITGAPKLRAMELIDQEERSRRNLYTGSIGYISLNGDCDLNIVIRTAVHKDGIYHLGVGGGITCESELEFEYEETWQKAKALLNALDAKPMKGDIYEHTVG